MYTLKIDMKLKSGETFASGSAITSITFRDHYAELNGLRNNGLPVVIKASSIAVFLKGFKKPSLSTMNKWMNDGIARSVTGKKCEPDGYGDDNSPSWLLVLGLI